MNNRKFQLTLLACFAIATLIFQACKKDRIPQDDYQNMDSFYDDNKEDEQEFTIDSTGGNCFVTCAKGTRICITRDEVSLLNGTDISYPFTLKVVELYSIKDMLLWRMPSVSGSTNLETSAELRVHAFKNGDELKIKNGKIYYMEMATLPVINNNMSSFYDDNSGGINEWTNSISNLVPGFVDTMSVVIPTATNYNLNIPYLNWVSADRAVATPSGTTSITLTVQGTNTQNIQLYLSYTNFKGLVKGDNLVFSNVPIGENVKMVVFGKKQNNDYVLQQSTFTVTAGMTIPLNLSSVSESDLLTVLGTL